MEHEVEQENVRNTYFGEGGGDQWNQMFFNSKIPGSESGIRQKRANKNIEGVGEQEHQANKVEVDECRLRCLKTTNLLSHSLATHLFWYTNGSSGVVEEAGHR